MPKSLSALAVWAGLSLLLAGPLALLQTNISPLHDVTEATRHVMAGGTIYVNASAGGTNTGESWTNAYTTLSAAIAAAHADASVTTILVAKGTYYPTGAQNSTNRDAAFTLLRAGLTISGGYDAATGTRDISANTTTLSGDIGTAGTNTDNSYHVLVAAGIPAGGDSLIVDGFTVEKGNANSSGNVTYGTQTIGRSEGGGIAINGSGIGNKLVLRNLLVTGNGAADGAGFCLRNVSDMGIHSCIFSSNNSSWAGGAVEINGSNPSVYSCSFLSNKAVYGAGIANYSSSPSIRLCRFQANSSEQEGGAIQSFFDSNPVIENSLFTGNSGMFGSATSTYSLTTIINCTIAGNKSTNGSAGLKGVVYSSSNTIIRNSIVFGNTEGISGSATVSNSLVQGYTGGIGNIAGWTDPQFTQPVQVSSAPTTSGNYRLQTSSPAINKGDNSAVSPSISTDLDGNPRIQLSTVDMGAYESASFLPSTEPDTLYVNQAAAGLNTGISWADAFTTLKPALSFAADHSSIKAILVAKGTYYPTGIQSDTDRAAYFSIPRAGLRIQGGYDAVSGTRNIASNITALSGNIGAIDTDTDNSYQVLVASNIPTDADSLIIDGFSVEKGYNSGLTSGGGGVVILDNNIGNRLVLRNLVILGNHVDHGGNAGGGAYLRNASNMVIQSCLFSENTSPAAGGALEIHDSSPLIENCSFLSNVASFGGGGIALYTSNPIIQQCRFQGNSSEITGAAILSLYSSSPSLQNCILSGNLSGGQGVAVGGLGSGPISITNCTISGNRADAGGSDNYAVSSDEAITIQNSIISGNTAGATVGGTYSWKLSITNSLVQDYTGGSGNLPGNTDPQFVSVAALSSAPTTAGDYRLSARSPAINAGNNALMPSEMTTDLDGKPRIQFCTVDLGAYEAAIAPNPATSPLASSTMSVSTIQSQTAKTDYFGNSCQELIASITGDGTPSSISGQTTMKVWLDATPVPHHVARHYEITPAANGSTATARITLYFTQAEFDAFNTANPLKPLPTGPSDNTGKANLLVVKRPGVSGNGTGAYDSYTTAPLVIDPADTDIVWSGSRWEVSFNVTGFSGFFVSTQSALPLRLLSFTAKRTSGVSHLEWKTASEKNVSHFQVERSADAQEFSAIRTIPAHNGESQTYTLDDVISIDGVMYYRLKMVDQDGSVTYSRTLSLTDQGAASMTDPALKLGPVPAKHEITLYLTRPEILGQEVQLTDQRGVVLDRLTITQLRQTYRVGGLVPGVYFFRLATGEAARFVKN